MMEILTGLATLAAIVYSVLTWRLLKETTLLRRAQTEPAISLHLEVGRHVNILNLVIQNHGQGTAYDLSWKLSPSPTELERYGAGLQLTLLDGFSHLAPGQRIEHFFGSSLELLECPPVTITVAYRDAARRPMSPMSFVLHPSQFKGITQCGEAAEEKIASALEKVAKTLDGITSMNRLRVTASAECKPWLAHLKAARERLDEEIHREAAASAAASAPAPLPVAVTAPSAEREHLISLPGNIPG